MTILLIGNLDAEDYVEWRQHLRASLPADETLVLANETYDPDAVEIAFVANPPRGEVARHRNLRFIQSLWAGVDRLLSDPTLPRTIPIARLIDPTMTQAMVECALAAVFHLHRQYPAYAAQQRRGEWKQLAQPLAQGRRVAVLGLGELGSAVARGLAALGFQVSGWSLKPREVPGIACHGGVAALPEVLAGAEILINLLPLTPDTAGILGAENFAKLPRGAGVVNLARGGHLDEPALLAALEAGQVGHAVLDVFATEPLPAGHPFWSHPGITVFPHVAAYSEPSTAARIACNNVANFRAGRALDALVDPARGY